MKELKDLSASKVVAVKTIFEAFKILKEEGGLFVTSRRFSPEAERFAREANVHIKLIDGEELISLWQQFYNDMNDEDKNLLPLHPVYFLGSNE